MRPVLEILEVQPYRLQGAAAWAHDFDDHLRDLINVGRDVHYVGHRPSNIKQHRKAPGADLELTAQS